MLAASTLLVAGCGDDSSGGAVAQRSDLRIDQIGEAVESGLPEGTEPVRGGQIVYGLEAETSHFCLSSAQVAVSGMQVMRAIYDPLVVPRLRKLRDRRRRARYEGSPVEGRPVR